jgi:hypothetical protein
MTLVSKIEGPISAAELLVQLAQLMSDNEADLVVARADKEERSMTQLIRQEQDQAYEQSLQADREKARLKREQEEARLNAEKLERQRREEEVARENVRSAFLNCWFISGGNNSLEITFDVRKAEKVIFSLLGGARILAIFPSNIVIY